MFVHFDSFQRVFERKEIATERGEEEANKVHFISMLHPEPFLDATIIGANIEDSLLYHWFRDWHGVEFVENTEISRRSRKMPETIGERLRVSYFIPGNRFASKHLFNQEALEGVSNFEKMNRLAIAEFKSEPFLYVPNNGTKSAIEDEPNCTPVPVVCHGLNRFSGYHNVYCPIALNREPFHLHMLEAGFGLSAEVVHRATAQETVYQIVSRTSLRLFDSTTMVHAIVPDHATARRLADLYGSKQVRQLGLGSMFNRPKSLTGAEKQRRYRERWKAANSPDSVLASIELSNEGDDSLVMTVIQCGNRYAKSRREFSDHRLTISDLMAFLREQSRRKVTKKAEGLFNLSVFDPPEGTDDYRTLEHFQSASGLVLDFDDGEMSPQEFERIFWSEAGRGRKISFVLMNTFSRRADRLNKFRVVIPFRRPAKSVEEFHAAYDYILRRIEERGYRKPPRIPNGPDLDAGGLDRSSRSPTQIFYWPCTNAAHPDAAFFRVWGIARVGAIRHGTPERSPKTLLRRRWRLLCPSRQEPPTKRRSKKPFANGATLAARPEMATKNSSALDFDSPMPAFPITKSNTRSPSSLNTPTPQGSTEEHSLCHAWSSSAPRTNTRSDDVIDFNEGRQGG